LGREWNGRRTFQSLLHDPVIENGHGNSEFTGSEVETTNQIPSQHRGIIALADIFHVWSGWIVKSDLLHWEKAGKTGAWIISNPLS
jgi:hypothetical protein